MARLYCAEAGKGKRIKLRKEQVRHLKVLRLKPGEPIYVFDGRGREYRAEYTGKVSEILLKEEITPQKEPSVEITLATAVPKGGRMDVLIEKASELGVKEIIPIICKRSIVKPREGKIARLRKISIEACAQSKRAYIPLIQEPISFKELMAKVSDYDAIYICHTGGGKMKAGKKVLVIVGPEGDFTDEELSMAKEVGAKMWKLSMTTLRIETAAIAAVAQLAGKDL